jgi:hypothetical protein
MSIEFLRALRKKRGEVMEAMKAIEPCPCVSCAAGWPCERGGMAAVQELEVLDTEFIRAQGRHALHLLQHLTVSGAICAPGLCSCGRGCEEIRETIGGTG